MKELQIYENKNLGRKESKEDHQVTKKKRLNELIKKFQAQGIKINWAARVRETINKK